LALGSSEKVIGSPEYVAPEQARGQSAFASDLYSLGVTCIHLLTQMPPFDLLDGRKDIWVWRRYIPQPVNPSLGRILDKMLQSATRWRYHSAAAILEDLNRLGEEGLHQDDWKDREKLSPASLPDNRSSSIGTETLTARVQYIPESYSGTYFDPTTQRWHPAPIQTELSSDLHLPETLSWKIAAFLASRGNACGNPIPILEKPLSQKSTRFRIHGPSGWIFGAIAVAVFVFLFTELQPFSPSSPPAATVHSAPLQQPGD
jgi:serine/threonine protein kinase